jgi:hypothetical protein
MRGGTAAGRSVIVVRGRSKCASQVGAGLNNTKRGEPGRNNKLNIH